MEDKAKLTIVIPVKDRAGIVDATLDSVHKQRLRPLDVVLVDNGSTDGTLAVLQAWKEHCEGPGFRVTRRRRGTQPWPGGGDHPLHDVLRF